MILAIALTLLRAVIDWFIIERLGRGINHALEEGIFFSAVAVGTLITQEPFFFAIAYGTKLLLQDLILNLMRGRNWDYLSEEDDAAWTDRQLRKLNKWTVVGLRVSGFILGCWLYYK